MHDLNSFSHFLILKIKCLSFLLFANNHSFSLSSKFTIDHWCHVVFLLKMLKIKGLNRILPHVV
jgi:hypothetical protein